MIKRYLQLLQGNTTLGCLPILFACLLSYYLPYNVSLYISLVMALMTYLFGKIEYGRVNNGLILSISTQVLLVLSVITMLFESSCMNYYFTFIMEVFVLVPIMIFYLLKDSFFRYYIYKSKEFISQRIISYYGAEVSAKIFLWIGGIHLAVVVLIVLSTDSLSEMTKMCLFQIAPTIVFLLCIFINHIGVMYLNKIYKGAVYLPLLNDKGEVMGKMEEKQALLRESEFILPIVRVFVYCKGKLLLQNEDNEDILTRGYLRYGEELQEGAKRILHAILGHIKSKNLYFNFMHFHTKGMNTHLNYVFLYEIFDDCIEELKDSFYSIKDIENLLGTNQLASDFEEEFKSMMPIICIREKYRES